MADIPTSPEVQVRSALTSDIVGMAKAYVEAFREVDPSERWSKDSAEKLIAYLVTTQPQLSFVAELDGVIVGGISGFAKPWWDGCHLVQTELFLSPNGQRQGLGSVLFLHYLNVAQSLYRATHIEAITFRGLEFPASWYTKLGFTEKGEWKVLIGDVEVLRNRLSTKAGTFLAQLVNK